MDWSGKTSFSQFPMNSPQLASSRLSQIVKPATCSTPFSGKEGPNSKVWLIEFKIGELIGCCIPLCIVCALVHVHGVCTCAYTCVYAHVYVNMCAVE